MRAHSAVCNTFNPTGEQWEEWYAAEEAVREELTKKEG